MVPLGSLGSAALAWPVTTTGWAQRVAVAGEEDSKVVVSWSWASRGVDGKAAEAGVVAVDCRVGSWAVT